MSRRKDVAWVTFLASWKIWNECNACLRNKHAPRAVIQEKIKIEPKLWMLGGAKKMSNQILVQ
jgi:hypothetical protein